MKKVLFFLSALLSAACAFPQWDGSAAPWTQGSGTTDDPYLIDNERQLAHMAIMVNSGLEEYDTAHYRLTTSLNLNNLPWNPIGTYLEAPFKGSFDGAGYCIEGLNVSEESTNSPMAGLFGAVQDCEITNLIVDGNVSTTTGSIAGIVGYALCVQQFKLRLIGLENRCNVSGHQNVGGIVGWLGILTGGYSYPTINNCINKGTLQAQTNGVGNFGVGGIVGQMSGGCPNSCISQCGNMGNITCVGDGITASGILGYLISFTTTYAVFSCFNTGNISISGTNGWVCGISASGAKNCYNAGMLSAGSAVYAVSESSSPNAVINCYCLDVCGGAPGQAQTRTQAQMQHPTFPTVLNGTSGNYFIADQGNVNGGYPLFMYMVPYNITTDAATEIGTYSAHLNGHYSGSADSIGFTYHALGSTAIDIVMASGSPASTTLSNLQPNTSYRFRFFAYIAGNRIYGDSLQFTTYPAYTVNATSSNTAQGSVTGSGIYGYGETAILVATPAIECQFNRWSDEVNTNPRIFHITSDIHITAYFGPRMYTIDAVSNDITYGTVDGGDVYATGTMVTLTAVPATGHHFVQWSDGITDNPRTFTALSDITLTAIFAPNSYNVNIVSNSTDMGFVTGSGTYTYGTTIEINAVPMQHFRFVQWSDGPADNPRTLIVDDDISIVALFEEKPQYQINVVSDNPQHGTVNGSGLFHADETITITAIAADGYRFIRWSDDSEDAIHSVVVNGPATYTAYFSPTIHNVVVYSADDNMGTVSGSGQYELGGQATVTATPAAGCRFVRWSNGVEANPYTFTIYGDVYLIATFERNNGINDADKDGYTVCVSERTMHIVGACGLPIRIYSILGHEVYRCDNFDGSSIGLPAAGVYMLSIGNTQIIKTVAL